MRLITFQQVKVFPETLIGVQKLSKVVSKDSSVSVSSKMFPGFFREAFLDIAEDFMGLIEGFRRLQQSCSRLLERFQGFLRCFRAFSEVCV